MKGEKTNRKKIRQVSENQARTTQPAGGGEIGDRDWGRGNKQTERVRIITHRSKKEGQNFGVKLFFKKKRCVRFKKTNAHTKKKRTKEQERWVRVAAAMGGGGQREGKPLHHNLFCFEYIGHSGCGSRILCVGRREDNGGGGRKGGGEGGKGEEVSWREGRGRTEGEKLGGGEFVPLGKGKSM